MNLGGCILRHRGGSVGVVSQTLAWIGAYHRTSQARHAGWAPLDLTNAERLVAVLQDRRLALTTH